MTEQLFIGEEIAKLAAKTTKLERDHEDARINTLNLEARIAALESANAALEADNEALNKYADDIRAMVESVAAGALTMLKAARCPIVPKLKFEPMPKSGEAATMAGDIYAGAAAVIMNDGRVPSGELMPWKTPQRIENFDPQRIDNYDPKDAFQETPIQFRGFQAPRPATAEHVHA